MSPSFVEDSEHELVCKDLLRTFQTLKLEESNRDARQGWNSYGQVLVEAEFPYALFDLCTTGGFYYVQEFVQEPNRLKALLEWTDKDGNTALICAASRELAVLVELLLESGADIDAQNDIGRTALMEAVLWGQWRCVNHILDKGAAWMEDNDGRSAVDLSKINERNERERWERLQKENIQRPYVSSRCRQQIADLLEPEEFGALESLRNKFRQTRPCVNTLEINKFQPWSILTQRETECNHLADTVFDIPTRGWDNVMSHTIWKDISLPAHIGTLKGTLDQILSATSCHHFDNAIVSSCPIDKNTLRLAAIVKEFQLPKSTRAMACINLDGHPTQYTMSGNSHRRLGIGVITGKNWTAEVMRIANDIAHDFGSNPRGWACHAELQAIAGYIHWYLPQLGIPCNIWTKFCFPFCSYPTKPRMVLIIVSHEMCKVCRPFVEAINDITLRRFGFAFDVREGSPNGRHKEVMARLAMTNIVRTSSCYI